MRRLTPHEALRQAEFKARAAMHRMRAALLDLECARIEEMAGEYPESSGRGSALLVYKQEKQHFLASMAEVGRLRGECGQVERAFSAYTPRPAAPELRDPQSNNAA